jgi:hypothetical protein
VRNRRNEMSEPGPIDAAWDEDFPWIGDDCPRCPTCGGHAHGPCETAASATRPNPNRTEVGGTDVCRDHV